MASAGSVYVDLLLRDQNYRQGWQRARNYTHAGSRQVQGDVGKMRQSFEGVLNPVNNLGTAVRNLGVIIAGSFSVQQLIQYSDTWKQLEGRLKVVQGDFENIGDTQQRLFEIAQRTRQPLENILGFYSRLKQFIPEAERAQYDLFNTTEGVATALALTGEISESATAAMIQLTQAIGTNFEAAGQELRSLQEQAPRLTTAIQRAFGDGDKTLQQLVKTGQLTRETFIAIFQDGSREFQKLQAELEKMPVTVAQAFQRLDNAFLKFIGQSEEAQSVTGALALGISNLAENLDEVARAIGLLVTVSFAAYASKIIRDINGPTLAAISVQTRYQAQVAQTSAVLGANSAASQRWAMAVQRANAAATGSLASSVVMVNRAGQAAVASASAFGLFTTSIRNLGAGLVTFLGGPVSAAFIGLSAAVYYLSTTQTEAEIVSERFSDRLAQMRDNGELLSQQLVQVGTEIEDMSDPDKWKELNELNKQLQEVTTSSEVLYRQLKMFNEGGFFENIKADVEELKWAFSNRELLSAWREVQAEFRNTGDVEAYAMAVNELAQEFPEFRDRATTILDLADLWGVNKEALEEYQEQQKRLESDFPIVPLPTVKPERPSSSGSSMTEIDDKELKKREAFLKSYQQLLTGLDAETLKYKNSLEELSEAQQNGWITANQLAEAQARLETEYRDSARAPFLELITGLDSATLKYIETEKMLLSLHERSLMTYQELQIALGNLDKDYRENAENVEQWGFDVESFGKKAAENIQDAFADFLFDPFEDGMDGMLKSFSDTLRRMVAEAASQSLLKGLFGFEDSGGTKQGGLLSGVTDSIGSWLGGLNKYADGGTIGPGQWGIAGEAGAELIYGGMSGKTVVPMNGGGGVSVNIINNAGANISTRPGTNGALLDVMIDQAVAKNIGTSGSQTSQALSNFNNRSITRR